jgi:hypothetical protein
MRMPGVDSRVVAALCEQLGGRDAALRGGAGRVGWKLGVGSRERIGSHIAVGYLTTDTVVAAGEQAVAIADSAHLHVDAELCVELGADVIENADTDAVRGAIARCWPALEIVDLAPRVGEPESIVASNVFHRTVAFGDAPVPLASMDGVEVHVNGQLQERASWPIDVPQRISSAAVLLAGVGERMCAGDRIITGSIIQVPVVIGDTVRADFGQLASIAIRVIADTTKA